MDAGDSARADARRPARVLAHTGRHESAGDGRHRVSRPRRRAARWRRAGTSWSSSRAAPAAAAFPARLVDGDIRDRAALERAAAGCDAISHSAALVSIWRRRRAGLRRRQRRRAAQRAGGRRDARTPRVLYTSSFVALPPRGRTDAARGERLPADQGRRRSRSPTKRCAAAARSSASTRAWSTVRARSPKATSSGGSIADHLKHRLPGLVGPEQPLVVRLRRRRRGGTLRGAGARARQAGATRSAARTRRSAASSSSCSSSPDAGRRRGFRFRSPCCSAPPRSCASTLFGGTPLITRGAVEIFRHDWSLDSSEAVARSRLHA